MIDIETYTGIQAIFGKQNLQKLGFKVNKYRDQFQFSGLPSWRFLRDTRGKLP